MNFLVFVLNVFERLKQPNKPIFISLKNRNAFLNYPIYLKYSRWIIIIIASIIPILAMLKSNNAIIILFTSVMFFIVLTKQFNWVKELNEFFQRLYEYDYLILEFIISNGLSSEKNGSIESAEFSYEEKNSEIIIYAVKNGDRFSSKLESLDTELSALLNLTKTEKIIRAGLVEYHFQKEKPIRKQVGNLPLDDDTLRIDIYGDFSVNLRNNYSMLVSGASGAGKSYFTYFYLTRFISQKLNGKHAKIMGIDPKQSDLHKLFRKANMPIEAYGTSNADAFRIVKHYLAEMEHRMALYDESSAFDSVGIDISLEPCLLVIEEYSSLVASMDSKQKKEFENMVAIIAQKARSLSWEF